MATTYTAKKLLIYCLFIASTSTLAAQRNGAEREQQRLQAPIAKLTIPAAMPHDFSVWNAMPQLAELQVFNPRETAGEAEVHLQIIPPNGKKEARSREFSAPVVVVASGWNTYTAGDLFSNIDLEWFDGNRRVMDFSDTLPEGQYRLHISLQPRTPLDSISPTQAAGVFTAVDLARPALAAPVYTWNMDSTLLESVDFVWKYPAHVILPGFQWIVRIAEAPPDSTTQTDIEHLPVVMERIVSDSTRLSLASPSSYFRTGHRYVWSVQPYNSGISAQMWPKPVVFALPVGTKNQ